MTASGYTRWSRSTRSAGTRIGLSWKLMTAARPAAHQLGEEICPSFARVDKRGRLSHWQKAGVRGGRRASSSASRMGARLRRILARWPPGPERRPLGIVRRQGCGASARRGRGAPPGRVIRETCRGSSSESRERRARARGCRWPRWRCARRACRPGRRAAPPESMASCRQLRMVSLTRGWSGMPPDRGNGGIRCSARMRWIGGGNLRPPTERGDGQRARAFQRHAW